MSFANSYITCLQIPQGNVYPGFLLATTSILNSLSPSETALNIAVLSAQLVAPKDEFSILHPVNIFPFLVKSAAPTGNSEYGTYALFIASFASWINFFLNSILVFKISFLLFMKGFLYSFIPSILLYIQGRP